MASAPLLWQVHPILGRFARVEPFLGREVFMRIGHLDVNIFKIRNRKGYAAVCADCLTEGKITQEVYDRMLKAVRRARERNSI